MLQIDRIRGQLDLAGFILFKITRNYIVDRIPIVCSATFDPGTFRSIAVKFTSIISTAP